VVPVEPAFPAVTCTAQATYVTGQPPSVHGAVGNGWYFRDECEVRFWRQSARLLGGRKLWEVARERDPTFTCANLFWWFNMYSSVDYAVTPRPMYPADGRKIPDVYTRPAGLRDELQGRLGRFPLFKFWGPGASIVSSHWIAGAARYVEEQLKPTLSLVYLPHLDYPLQRHGPLLPALASDLGQIDAVCGELIDFYEQRGVQVVVLSEYGIAPVSRPVHLNRLLRAEGLLAVREELGRELLDAGASEAFAVADHQVAHVYVRERGRLEAVRRLLESIPGVAEVLDEEGKRAAGIDHPRAGELVAVAEPDSWFTYYTWLDDSRAPDFARTVDIHRKPGYDPAELFLDPRLRLPRLSIAANLLKQRLGFRTLLKVVPLDPVGVRGSHGRRTTETAEGPLLASRRGDLLEEGGLPATRVFNVLLAHLGVPEARGPDRSSGAGAWTAAAECREGMEDEPGRSPIGEDHVLTRREEILEVADRYGVRGLRWWPPQPGDFVVASLPDNLRQLQADLERTLGCRVAIYLVENWAEEARRRVEAETIEL
jgi:predicted AlkP superfamily pyrophosphatase or phosphodiesterase